MKLTLDTTAGMMLVQDSGPAREISLYSAEGFRLLSEAWVKTGWGLKYSYTFTWLGRPIIQLPEDMIRIQEIVYQVRPEVLVEIGVAHGGSLIFYASLFKAMGHGRVIGVDIEIRPHNRKAMEEHVLFPHITLIEGDSISKSVLERVRSQIKSGEKVLVVLDGNHTRQHVLAELEAYAPLVGPDSYIVVADGVMESLEGAPGSKPDWSWNNPKKAVVEFLRNHPEFLVEEPAFSFNEGQITERVTYWPSAFVRRRA